VHTDIIAPMMRYVRTMPLIDFFDYRCYRIWYVDYFCERRFLILSILSMKWKQMIKFLSQLKKLRREKPINISHEGNNSEVVATYILKELDYKILHSSGLEKRKMVLGLAYASIFDKKIIAHYNRIIGKLEKSQRSLEQQVKHHQEMLKEFPNNVFRESTRTVGDILCEKEGKGYLFDVKLKFFKENKNLNVFSVTDNEVLNYDQLTKSGKVSVKILINLKKDDGYYYGIFDWKDFTYSKNYDPQKTAKTTIRLKDGLDISKLKKFENVRNYKFKKYLDISKIKKYYYNS